MNDVADNAAETAGTPAAESSAHDDRDLASRIRAGDVQGFEELYHQFAPSLLRVAYARLRSREIAEDVVQEVFLSLWQHRENWVLRKSLRSYIFTMLRNQIVQYQRHMQAREWRLRRVAEADGMLEAIPGSASTDHDVRENELAAAIERAIGQLSPRNRETFYLIRRDGLSYVEAAEALGISVKGVEMNMVRALAALRKELSQWNP